MKLLYTSCIWVCFILIMFSCRPEGMVVRADKEVFTIQDQVKIGKSLSDHISENPIEFPIYVRERNPEMYLYLDELLNQATTTQQVINRNEFDWEINVVRDSRMTAYVLPGGVIYITDSFLKFIETESFFMAVLSHEMYYADKEASMNKLKEHFTGLELGDLVFGNPVNNKGEMINTLKGDPFTFSEVEVADAFSVNLLCNFKHAPDALATFLEKEVPDTSFPIQWTLTRPFESMQERIASIRESARIIELNCATELVDDMNRFQENVINFLD